MARIIGQKTVDNGRSKNKQIIKFVYTGRKI